MAGILSLGYIQDGLRANDFSEAEIQKMWGVIIENIDGDNLELTQVVAVSVENLAPTTELYFEDAGKREVLMNAIFKLLSINDAEIRARALQALITIISKNFQYIGDYLDMFY